MVVVGVVVVSGVGVVVVSGVGSIGWVIVGEWWLRRRLGVCGCGVHGARVMVLSMHESHGADIAHSVCC